MSNQPNNKLTNGCINILNKYCESNGNEISIVPDNGFYSIKCKYPIPHKDDRNNIYQLIKLKGANKIGVHFALKFIVNKKSSKKLEYELTDANLKFFYLNDNLTNILFRAEFSTNNSIPHAQPHWQFEPYRHLAVNKEDRNVLLELRKDEIDLLDAISEEKKNEYNISKIHFAMISDWHKPQNEKASNSHIVEINERNVINWLDGCLNYISNQISNYK